MDKAIFIVGVGGTGGMLAAKLSKMLEKTGCDLWLIDGDCVELSNTKRQPFQKFNVDEKKAAALSRKIRSNYNIPVYEYSNYITGDEIYEISNNECYEEVLIAGCVDNHSTRLILESQYMKLKNVIYIDSANGSNDGSIFLARKIQDKVYGDLRSNIFPDMKTANDHPSNTCSKAISEGNIQQFVTNDLMANTVARSIYDWICDDFRTGVILIDGFERIFNAD